MKSLTKKAFSFVLCTALACGGISAFAADHMVTINGVAGGWSESDGYFVRETSSSRSSEPKYHWGKLLKRAINGGGDTEKAAHGETVWPDTSHYTTAQMEDSSGTVLSTSGRRWNIGYSEAESPYILASLFVNEEARTYWGH